MKGNEIRSRFLNYFKENGHTVVDSSSLVPKDDPTLLFTNAGMVQFKMVFMGEDKRDYVKAVTSQRCVRAGGKHNDLENVGYTARHHTFFEMLGNFSFGDYFKEDAIRFAWSFLTVELGIPAGKLWVSIFEDDDEAYALWDKVENLPKGRIVRMGEKDNFWAMGDTGPCGPCSEIHIDQGDSAGCGRPDCALGCDCDRFLELWNLVFMQFNRSANGEMTRLPKPSIDTGMGLERVAAVLQGKFNNYDSDLFTPIIAKIESLSKKSYGKNNQDDTAMRVIADHARATSFLVADGVLPSNEGAGYVLRRIIRRAVRYGKHLGLQKPFMEEVCNAVVGEMASAYPHIKAALSLLAQVVTKEEERFRETLENGLTLLDEEISRMTRENLQRIPGSFIFKLYDTFGFPFDIVRDIALERGYGFDEPGFLLEMENQRQKSRSSRKDEGVKLLDEGVKNLAAVGKKTQFAGYHDLSASARVEGLLDDEGRSVKKLAVGQKGRLYVESTPFYAESGGQVGDCGVVSWQGGQAKVMATSVASGKIVLHEIEVTEGVLVEATEVALVVDKDRRRAIATHHSATHMLHAALRNLLGDHVKQAGSMVGPDRLRFDFTHFSPLTQEQIERIELLVNAQIWLNVPVTTRILQRDEAMKEGAMALFGEKYEENVRVVAMAAFSKELCGGTHVDASGEIGVCKILSESGIASGVRRIEALAGPAAFAYIQGLSRRERQIAGLLNAGHTGEIVTKVETLLTHAKTLEKQIADLSRQLASSDLEGMLQNFVSIEGVKVISSEIQLDSQKTLREVGDRLRDNLQSGVIVLGGSINGKAALLAVVTSDLTTRIKAGDIINKVALQVGGKGGGRADMAQAGGPMVDKLGEAINSVPGVVSKLLRE
ncbi:MAG: alanine--tRNA ligase [Proteobacteria bacterium]|nr:alanine--tRNA ligase [Pseudomonadota bacterium]